MSNSVDVRPTRWLAGALLAGSLVSTGSFPSIATAETAPPPAAKGGFNLETGMNALDKTLAKADATPDQKAKIKAVIFDAFMSLGAQAPTIKTTATAFATSLMTPRVDRAGLESARVLAVSEFDAFSKVMVKAIGDAAEVLTPGQRAKLAPAAKPKG